MTWNVKRNSVFPPDGVRHESFARIVRAIDPDVIALQEVVRLDTDVELARLMNRYVPLEDGDSWHVHSVSDNALISRYPLRWQDGQLAVPYPIPQWGLPDFHFGFASALIDLPERFGGTDLLVVAMHNKSGADESHVRMRQMQSDATVSWMRDLRNSAQRHAIADSTPIVILGDMNVVPQASMQPFETLLSGNIADEETFGPDFRIDWDGTEITDAKPSHNSMGREYYTWRNDDLPFEPSALDRILYTDSVTSVRQRFVLNTMTMSSNDLDILGLQKSDALFGGNPNYYDHLPLVVDFTIESASLELNGWTTRRKKALEEPLGMSRE
jgi:endonuclease/exonuclease/phosphatase family metal-dependent hydrolase